MPPLLVTPPEPVDPPLPVVPPVPVAPPVLVLPPSLNVGDLHALVQVVGAGQTGVTGVAARQVHSSSPGVQLGAPPATAGAAGPAVGVAAGGGAAETRQKRQEKRNSPEIRRDTHGKGRILSKRVGVRNLGVLPKIAQAAVGAGALLVSVRRSYFLDFQMVAVQVVVAQREPGPEGQRDVLEGPVDEERNAEGEPCRRPRAQVAMRPM